MRLDRARMIQYCVQPCSHLSPRIQLSYAYWAASVICPFRVETHSQPLTSLLHVIGTHPTVPSAEISPFQRPSH
jgi:hypothetical protein